MIARELSEFFAGFEAHAPGASGNGASGNAALRPVVQRSGDPVFLSNVNACYARACWEEIRFRELAYSEDQAFGADLLAAGWAKVYHPGARRPARPRLRRGSSSCAAISTSTAGCARAPATSSRSACSPLPGRCASAVAADRSWMAERGMDRGARARWTAKSVAHHGGRRVFSALGSRSQRVPAPLRRRLSLENRAEAGEAGEAGAVSGREEIGHVDAAAASEPSLVPAGQQVEQKLSGEVYDVAARVWQDGPAPLLDAVPGMAERDQLRLAMVIPPFSKGSGGHNTLFQIFTRLERRGHACSVWLVDYYGYARAVWPAVLRHDIDEFFAPFQGPVYKGFEAWQGADVAIATGWQTVHAMLSLERCRARAYVVNDHEPEFYPASVEHALAADTYRYGMHCIAASPWLRDLLIARYDTAAESFQLGRRPRHLPSQAGRQARGHGDLLRPLRHPATGGADRPDGARRAQAPPAGRAHRPVWHRRSARRLLPL